MRVLYFTRDYTPHDHRFLSALAESEHTVSFLRLERRGMQREDRPIPAAVEQIHWYGGDRPARWQEGLRLVSSLRQVLRRVQPDVVHAGSVQTAAFLTAAAGFHPLVSMSWGSDLLKDADRSRAWRWATQFTLRRTDVLVGDCQAVADRAAEFGFPRERMVLFPWGVDLTRFSPGEAQAQRARMGWEDAFVILSLRAWEPLYGVDVVVRAFCRAAREVPELRLVLLGGGSQAAELRRLLEQAGMTERVWFGGQVSNAHLADFYRLADVYVSAAYSDGSSVSLMEALACGRAAAVTDIPSNAEWVQTGEHGWRFPAGDAEALAAVMVRAAQDRAALARMGSAARRLAEERADWKKNFQKLLAAYDLAVQTQAKRRAER